MRHFLALAVLALLCGCGGGGGAGGKSVGLVFDVGGRGDKSFNDSAYEGLERAKRELGVDYTYIEPGEGADRESALRQLAAEGRGLIFGTGFLFTDDINSIAADFPDKMFACVDYALNPRKAVPRNVVALKFREEEGSFLVGAIAGLVTKTNTVGFVGGMDIPLIHKFELGYTAGVKAVNPRCRVLAAYAGVTGEAFKNPAKGKALAISQIDKRADIIFHASGTTGFGVFEAARERKIKAIGVDGDQYNEAPGYILTSMVKKVDVAVFGAVRAWLAGRLRGGVYELGLANGAVGYVYDKHNRNLIPPDVIAQVEELKRQIIGGEIQIPRVK
ncbi:MAG: BMP family ABC transporter substrate-binding protein [Elusimicrobiales bacterium]